MKATALIAAAALVCGSAAFAQQQDTTANRGETATSGDSIKPADDAQRTKNAVKNFGHKTRNAMHRAGDKVRDMAHNDKAGKDRHARADRHGDKHARADRHHDRHHDRYHDRQARDRDDTRSMGAMGSDMRDADASRRQRMDDAYANWKQKNG